MSKLVTGVTTGPLIARDGSMRSIRCWPYWIVAVCVLAVTSSRSWPRAASSRSVTACCSDDDPNTAKAIEGLREEEFYEYVC